MHPDSWTPVSVDELKAKTNNAIAIGPFGSRLKTHLYEPDGVPVLRGSNIADDRRLRGEFVFVGERTADQLRSSNVFAGDLVFPHRGAIGRVAIVPEDNHPRYQISTSLMKLTCDPNVVEPLFLFYFFRSPDGRHELLKNASTVGTPGIGTPLASLRSIEVALPPLSEQRGIARLLGALDDKIELNRRMSETLQEAIRLLFHRLNDGAIKRSSIADLAEYINGRNFTKDASGNGRMVIRIAELNSGRGGSTVFSDADAADEHVARFGDILFAWSGSLGVYRWYGGDALINQHIFKVLPNGYPRWFVHQHLLAALPFFRETAADKATTMGHIKRGHLSEAKVGIPTPEALAAASEVIEPLDERIGANERESRTHVALRDALLPKLISGELRIRDAERAGGESQ